MEIKNLTHGFYNQRKHTQAVNLVVNVAWAWQRIDIVKDKDHPRRIPEPLAFQIYPRMSGREYYLEKQCT